MKTLKPYQFENNQIRIILDDNGKPLFVGKDVASALGYTNPQKALRDHCKKSIKVGVNDSFTLDFQTILIPESDLYRLILRSKLDSAERFQDWVVEEVLPSIRETGSYSVKDHPQWLQAREQGKIARREETDTIKAFIEYAKGQGGTPSGCDRYYATITTEEYKALFLADEFKNLRERLPFGDLATLMVAEEIVKRALQQGMDDGLHYKDVYKLAKSKLLNFSDLKGKKPVAQTRLIH